MKRLLIIASFPAFILAARYIPFDHLPPVCFFHYYTHYPCPTCGMTRSVASIARFRFRHAWEMNPLGFGFLILLMSFWANSVRESFIGCRTRFSVWMEEHAIILTLLTLGTMTVFGIVRIWLCANGFFYFPAG